MGARTGRGFAFAGGVCTSLRPGFPYLDEVPVNRVRGGQPGFAAKIINKHQFLLVMNTWLKSITACIFLAGMATGMSAAAPSVEAASVDSVLQPYYSITNALAADDPDAAQSAALDLKQAADGNEALSDVKLSADRITDASDLADARRGLSDLTADMRRLIESAGTVGNVPVFVVHCPMAFDGRGADWLQRDKAVSNPYFGSMMLKCGAVTDVLGSEAPAPAGGK